VRKRISKCVKEKKKGSIIIQEYIVKPLLYNGRKFDIRAYMMITYHNGKTKAYWYQEGYVRTSSHFFSLSEMSDSYVHLTNDAVQQHSETYGRF
jgi:tubulin---tyrosine ligase